MTEKAKLISDKPRFVYEVDDFTIFFEGTEVEKNQFHYEQFVRIYINEEYNSVGIVHHLSSENGGTFLKEPWFSLTCMRECAHQAIFKAQKLLYKDLGIL